MKNHTKIIWFRTFIQNKTLFGSKPLHIIIDKVNGFIRIFDGIRYLVFFGPKNMMPFTIELDILLNKKCFFW